jgi:hypothetical protein
MHGAGYGPRNEVEHNDHESHLVDADEDFPATAHLSMPPPKGIRRLAAKGGLQLAEAFSGQKHILAQACMVNKAGNQSLSGGRHYWLDQGHQNVTCRSQMGQFHERLDGGNVPRMRRFLLPGSPSRVIWANSRPQPSGSAWVLLVALRWTDGR